MKKLLLFSFLIVSGLVSSQTVYFEDDFSNEATFSNWTLYNVDGFTPASPVAAFANAWIRVDRAPYGGPTGNFCAGSTSWFDPAGIANRWMVSPAITLPAGSNPTLYWDAKAQDAQFPDGYEVRISTSNTQAAVSTGTVLFSVVEEQPTWQSRNLSLAAYAGQTVYISFRNNSNDKFLLLVDNIIVSEPLTAPGCASLVSPANNATDVSFGTVTLTWEAPTTGGAVVSYDVYFDTTDGTTLLGNTPNLTVDITGLLAETTYFWNIIAKNAAGDAVGCNAFTFTTASSPFSPYCGPLVFTSATEPITLLNFAGINYTAPNAILPAAQAHQFISSPVGAVSSGQSYDITLKGNTDGDFENRFVVFIDWNQNGILDDQGEVYFGDGNLTISNSTGLDAIQATGTIAVPADALPGTTRMRVKKLFGATNPNTANPCLGAGWGQVLDFNITVENLSTDNFEFSKLVSIYPNPVNSEFTINIYNSVSSTVDNVKVIDVNGRVVKSFNNNSSSYNISDLTSGVYFVEISSDQGKTTKKIIKN